MTDTVAQFEHVISICRDLYAKKLKDYGPSWRIMRPQSITDQIFIKANRIRSIEIKGECKVDEGIRSELIAIVNYGIIGLIQLELGYSDGEDISVIKKRHFSLKINKYNMILFCLSIMTNDTFGKVLNA